MLLLFGAGWQTAAQEKSEQIYSPCLKTYETGEQEVEVKQVLPAPLKASRIPFFKMSNNNSKSSGMQMAEEGPPVPGGDENGTNEGWPTNTFPEAFNYTNGELYVAIDHFDSNWMTLKIVNTIENGFYEIFTKTNLSETNWTLDHGLIGQSNSTMANPIWLSGQTNLFFRARNSGQDEDGDGLPDWWEIENGFNPALSDTGNTGTSDGYKDDDGDGWSNLEEFQNGTSPGGFNTPPVPRGLTVALNSSGTVAELNWNPSGGAVTGYEIERSIYSNHDSFSVGASSQSYADNSVPAVIDRIFGGPSYRVRATYSAGNSAWSPYVPIHPEQVSSEFWLLRGPGEGSYFVASVLPQETVAVKVTSLAYYDYDSDPMITESTFSITNFINGIAHLKNAEIESNPQLYGGNWIVHLAQIVLPNGTLGKIIVVFDSNFGNISFFDGREQLKQNLSFLLRAADMAVSFDPIVSPYNGERSGAQDYAYASFNNRPNLNYVKAKVMEFRPFEDNYIYRNFAFDPTRLDFNGKLTNGIGTYIYSELPFLDETLAPFRFEAPENAVPIAGILTSNDTRWIYHQSHEDRIGITQADTNYVMASAAKNIFGLDYVSVHTASGYDSRDLYPGDSVWIPYADYFYPEVAQPELRTVDYYFGRAGIDPLPGEDAFSPTNTMPVLLMSGSSDTHVLQFAGYAKQAIDNGDPNKFGYLGLYFDKAYKVNLDGTISTNETGILSEYGEFFPTEPGRVWLTTKPESVGETNIGGCVVHTIKLELDVNHDGTIDRTITGPDNTSYERPFVFWVNNDNDNPTVGEIEPHDHADSNDSEIKSTRDLEDFARLWISGVPSLPSSEGYSVTLSWQYDSGPTIRVYNSIETDGGMAYLTNGTTASNIVSSSYRFALGTVSNSSAYTFPADYFDGTDKHFIFEGASAGEGELVLTISKNNQPIASTSIYISIKDIKDLYEQVLIDNVTPGLPPSSLISRYTGVKSPSTDATGTAQLIVFVHGINNTEFDYHSSSETMFKRLYWSGYQGRFSAVRWPCAYLPFENTFNPFNYNKGEFYAWKSAPAFRAYLQNFANAHTNYQINILAHSQGNVVASEAIKLGAPFDNYILSQAAVPAHCYDTNAPFLQKLLDAEISPSFTPFAAADGGYHGYFTNLTGRLINFYNTNDFALAKGTYLGAEANWEENQRTQKPESFFGQTSYRFDGTNCLRVIVATSTNTVTDLYEKESMVARSRSRAVGAQEPASGQTNQGVIRVTFDLGTQLAFGNTRDEHSAQFTRSIQTALPYYREVKRTYDPVTP